MRGTHAIRNSATHSGYRGRRRPRSGFLVLGLRSWVLVSLGSIAALAADPSARGEKACDTGHSRRTAGAFPLPFAGWHALRSHGRRSLRHPRGRPRAGQRRLVGLQCRAVVQGRPARARSDRRPLREKSIAVLGANHARVRQVKGDRLYRDRLRLRRRRPDRSARASRTTTRTSR